VVGANGFVGSHLVDALAAAGHEVTAFDRFSSGAESYTQPGVRKVVGDFMNRADLQGALRGQDQLFHFLSTTSPVTAENDPTFDIRTNVVASVECFQMCVDAGVQRVTFASTGGAIYGDQATEDLCETDPTLPVSPYAIGKLAIEHYLRYFQVKYGLDHLALRLSNPYGTRQHANRRQGVIPIFLHEVAAGRPLTVYGDGSMVRDYIYLDDLVAMIAATVDRTCAHHTYNLGSGRGSTVNEIVDTIRAVTGMEVATTPIPTPPTFVHRVVLDVSRFTGEFGVGATTNLETGIARLWAELGGGR
jgi:UDP-glucose 4-epimerase